MLIRWRAFGFVAALMLVGMTSNSHAGDFEDLPSALRFIIFEFLNHDDLNEMLDTPDALIALIGEDAEQPGGTNANLERLFKAQFNAYYDSARLALTARGSAFADRSTQIGTEFQPNLLGWWALSFLMKKYVDYYTQNGLTLEKQIKAALLGHKQSEIELKRGHHSLESERARYTCCALDDMAADAFSPCTECADGYCPPPQPDACERCRCSRWCSVSSVLGIITGCVAPIVEKLQWMLCPDPNSGCCCCACGYTTPTWGCCVATKGCCTGLGIGIAAGCCLVGTAHVGYRHIPQWYQFLKISWAMRSLTRRADDCAALARRCQDFLDDHPALMRRELELFQRWKALFARNFKPDIDALVKLGDPLVLSMLAFFGLHVEADE